MQSCGSGGLICFDFLVLLILRIIQFAQLLIFLDNMKFLSKLFFLITFPLITFASTETHNFKSANIDSLNAQFHIEHLSTDSSEVKKPINYYKIAKSSGILSLVGIGAMALLGIAGVGTLSVLIGSALCLGGLILGLASVRKIKNNKWARLGVIFGALGILVLVAWIGLIIYVVYLFSNGID